MEYLKSTYIKNYKNHMNQVQHLRKQFTYPYRYVKLSRQIIVKNPQKIRSNIKKVTLHCAPGIVSEVMSETLLSPVKTTTPDIIEHYIMGLCLHTIVTVLILNTVKIFHNDDENENEVSN